MAIAFAVLHIALRCVLVLTLRCAYQQSCISKPSESCMNFHGNRGALPAWPGHHPDIGKRVALTGLYLQPAGRIYPVTLVNHLVDELTHGVSTTPKQGFPTASDESLCHFAGPVRLSVMLS